MTRSLVLAALSLVGGLAACPIRDLKEDVWDPPPPITQAEYTYSQCDNEDGELCPRVRTAQCAVDWLSESHSWFCLEDEECELVQLRPRCFSVCGPFVVNADEVENFRAEAQWQIDVYCNAGDCSEVTECPRVEAIPVCKAGRCGWVEPCEIEGGCHPDAGEEQPDGGELPDASEHLPDGGDLSDASQDLPDGGCLPDASDDQADVGSSEEGAPDAGE